jgi:hypothetical protein
VTAIEEVPGPHLFGFAQVLLRRRERGLGGLLFLAGHQQRVIEVVDRKSGFVFRAFQLRFGNAAIRPGHSVGFTDFQKLRRRLCQGGLDVQDGGVALL